MPSVGRGTGCAAIQRSISIWADSARQRTSRWHPSGPGIARERQTGRAAAQPVKRHAHVAFHEGQNAREVALYGAAAVVHNERDLVRLRLDW